MKARSIAVLVLVFAALIGFAALIAFGVKIGDNEYFTLDNINQGLDLKGGVSILYEAEADSPSRDEMNSAAALIQGRLDRRGWTEAEVAIEGSDRIRVDIPGIDDVEQAIEELGAMAQLFFAEVLDDTSFRSEDDMIFEWYDMYTGEMADFRIVLTGENVSTAYRTVHQESQTSAPQQAVALEFDSTGSYIFEEATGRNIGKPLYIFLDFDVLNAPTVNSRISGGNAVITGSYTVDEAEELAALIRSGSLPFSLNIIYMRNVGAKLGAEALDTSILAAVIGLCLVLVFMLIVYRFLGFTASLALLLYAELFLIMLSLFNITLTLPGIAGVILGVGMAVDANIIIFERIRDELSSGKVLMAAIDKGIKRAIPAILDGNVTTLIAALVLFLLGSGPVRGFAQTLTIGVLLSMFCALIITRFIIVSFVNAGVKNPSLFSGKKGEAAV